MLFFDIIAFVKQFQPIFSFACFFQCNVHFGIKVGFTLTANSFFNICTNTCAASKNLL